MDEDGGAQGLRRDRYPRPTQGARGGDAVRFALRRADRSRQGRSRCLSRGAIGGPSCPSARVVLWSILSVALLYPGCGRQPERGAVPARSAAVPPPSPPTTQPSATRRTTSRSTRPMHSWEPRDRRCAPVDLLPPDRGCERAVSTQHLFESGTGCAANLGGELPCDRFLDPLTPVRAARASASSADPLTLELKLVGLDVARSDHMLCECTLELRALGYHVDTGAEGVIGMSSSDRVELIREADGALRYAWSTLGPLTVTGVVTFAREVGRDPAIPLAAARARLPSGVHLPN